MASHASSVLKSAVTASRLDAAPCLLQSDCNYSDKFSILEVFLFPFEKTFDAVSAIKFSKDHFWLGPLACIFYLLFVYAGPRYMKRRPAYDLRTPLRWWNLFCAVLSFWGMLRVVPHLWIYIRHVGMGTSLCAPPVVCFRRSAAGFWGTVFLYSKVIATTLSRCFDAAFVLSLISSSNCLIPFLSFYVNGRCNFFIGITTPPFFYALGSLSSSNSLLDFIFAL